MAPVERRPHGPVTGKRDGVGRQDVEIGRELLRYLPRAEPAEPRRSELECQRKAVHSSTDLDDRRAVGCVQDEGRVRLARSTHKESHGIGVVLLGGRRVNVGDPQGRYEPHRLAGDAERFA